MGEKNHRAMRMVFYGMAAVVLFTFGIGHCAGQIVAAFHPQPRPQRHTRVWNAVVCNDGAVPVTVNHAMLSRHTAGRLALLNVYARGYEQGRSPRHIIARVGDTLAGLSDGFVTGVATEAIKYDGKLTIAAAVYSGVWKIAGGVYRETRNLALTAQPFWDDRKVQIEPGECAEAAVASLRPEDKTARRAQEGSSIEVRIPVAQPLSMLAPAWRVDTIDWHGAAARALAPLFAPASCLVRPSSVVDEGCGGWYGPLRGKG